MFVTTDIFVGGRITIRNPLTKEIVFMRFVVNNVSCVEFVVKNTRNSCSIEFDQTTGILASFCYQSAANSFHTVTVEIEVKYFSYSGSFFDILNVMRITGLLSFYVLITKGIVAVKDAVFSADKLSCADSL